MFYNKQGLGFCQVAKNRAYNSQQGVTLLLGILILASLLAISFSLATILFIEVRSSADILKSESSFYASTGIGEEAFYNLQRSVCSGNAQSCLSGMYPVQFGNNVSLVGVPSILATGNPIFQDKVPAYTSFTTTTNKYDFCDAKSGANGCGYGKVTVKYISTGNDSQALYAYLCQYDPNAAQGTYQSLPPCGTLGQSQGYWLQANTGQWQSDGSMQLTGLTANSYTWTLDPTKQQELILTAPSAANPIYFSVQTYDIDGVTPKGLPYIGKTAVQINTQSGALARKIQVVVPNGSSSSSAAGTNVSSLSFNGSAGSYVNVPNIAAYNISNFTVEAWVYPTRLNYSDWQPIVTKEASFGSSRNFAMYVALSGSTVHYSFQQSDCTTYNSYNSIGSLTPNAWNHVAETYDGTTLKFYLNGILDSSQTPTGGICTSSNGINIGGEASAYTPLLGLIDDVRVWNVARSAAQISANKSVQLIGNEAGLVGYWKFNENAGTSASDSTSNSNAGTLNSTAWSTNVPF